MADVQPFRAVRYTGAAGALADLVAPPYDAVSAAERAELYTRSPYNVVHVTLPDSPEEASRLYRQWLVEGILAEETEAAAWVVAEEYHGPDRVRRDRHGVVVSLAAEPYETGAVLPHERTHPRIREGRRRLLEATRVQPEPILLVADASLELALPDRDPDVEVDGVRLWRDTAFDLVPLSRAQLLIADGHHRYESTVELGDPARIMALVVPAADPGLQIFPTHRVFRGRPDLRDRSYGEPVRDLEEALGRLRAEPLDRSVAVAFLRGRIELVRAEPGELDVDLVDRFGLEGVSYSHELTHVVEPVELGEADVAFLLRPQQVETVFAVARSGERMPPKSTYFFPKPLSGLLFHPVRT